MIYLANGLAVVFLGEPQKAGSLGGATKTLAEGRGWRDESPHSLKVVQSSLCVPRPQVLEPQGVYGPQTAQQDQNPSDPSFHKKFFPKRNAFMLVGLLQLPALRVESRCPRVLVTISRSLQCPALQPRE